MHSLFWTTAPKKWRHTLQNIKEGSLQPTQNSSVAGVFKHWLLLVVAKQRFSTALTMCRLTPQSEKKPSDASAVPPSQQTIKSRNFSIWPLPIWLVISAASFLPSYCFLNCGYTKWCHWLSFAYFLTHNKVLCQFICIQSLLINVGWYCTVGTDYWYDGRVGDVLFRNLPTLLSQHILEG